LLIEVLCINARHRQATERFASPLKDDTTDNKRTENLKDKEPTLQQNQKSCNPNAQADTVTAHLILPQGSTIKLTFDN